MKFTSQRADGFGYSLDVPDPDPVAIRDAVYDAIVKAYGEPEIRVTDVRVEGATVTVDVSIPSWLLP